MSCCLAGSRMAESEPLSVHGISLQRHSSEVVGNTRRCPEGCCCCVVLYRHSKLLGCYWSPVLGLNKRKGLGQTDLFRIINPLQ